MTKIFIFGPAIAATLGLFVSAAAAAVMSGDYVGKTKADIAASLEQQGYEVRRLEEEDGNLEAYAVRDRQRFEIYVDPQTGNVVKIEQDD